VPKYSEEKTCSLHMLTLHLDYRQLLDLETTCKWMASACNDPEIWRIKLHDRVKRAISTVDPKSMYRRALRAGSPRYFIANTGHGSLAELEQRRDVVKVSYWRCVYGDAAAVVTLDSRCLLYRDGHDVEELGPAEDALIHQTQSPHYIAILNEGEVRVVAVDSHRTTLLLDLQGVERILALTETARTLYLMCIVKGDLLCVGCGFFPTTYRRMVTGVYDAFVGDIREISWSRDRAKYIHYTCTTTTKIRAHLQQQRLRYAMYSDHSCPAPAPEPNHPHVGEMSSRPTVPTMQLESTVELDGVLDMAIHNGELLLKGKTMYVLVDELELVVDNVLWMRSSTVSSVLSYIVEL
jgi:hypothetical protein